MYMSLCFDPFWRLLEILLHYDDSLGIESHKPLCCAVSHYVIGIGYSKHDGDYYCSRS